MSIRVTVTGHLSQTPQPKQTRAGKTYLPLNIGCTPRHKNQQSGQWEDDGDPLWVRATLWEEQAHAYGPLLQKGTRVVAEGNMKLEIRQAPDGKTWHNLTLTNPTIGIIPKNQAQPQGQGQLLPQTPPPAQHQDQAAQPAQASWGENENPWATNPPF